MSEAWYYRTDDEVRGPLNLDEMVAAAQSGRLKTTDKVRYGEAGDWKPAVDFIKMYAAAKPPGKTQQQRVARAATSAGALESPAVRPPKSKTDSHEEPQHSDHDPWRQLLSARIISAEIGPSDFDSQIENWYVRSNDQKLGPLTFDGLVEMARSGKLKMTDHLRWGPSGHWKTLVSTKEPASPASEPKRTSVPPPKPEPRPKSELKSKPESQPKSETQPKSLPKPETPPPSDVEPKSRRQKARTESKPTLPAILPEYLLPPSDESALDGHEVYVGIPFLEKTSKAAADVLVTPTKSEKKPNQSQGSQLPKSLKELVKKYPGFCFVIGAGLLLALVVKYMPSGSKSADVRTYRRFLKISSDIQELRSKNARNEEWLEYNNHVKPELKAIVEELSNTAGNTEPAKQRLLFAGRDCLHKMLVAGNRKAPEAEDFKTHMDAVKQLLEIEEPAEAPQAVPAVTEPEKPPQKE